MKEGHTGSGVRFLSWPLGVGYLFILPLGFASLLGGRTQLPAPLKMKKTLVWPPVPMQARNTNSVSALTRTLPRAVVGKGGVGEGGGVRGNNYGVARFGLVLFGRFVGKGLGFLFASLGFFLSWFVVCVLRGSECVVQIGGGTSACRTLAVSLRCGFVICQPSLVPPTVEEGGSGGQGTGLQFGCQENQPSFTPSGEMGREASGKGVYLQSLTLLAGIGRRVVQRRRRGRKGGKRKLVDAYSVWMGEAHSWVVVVCFVEGWRLRLRLRRSVSNRGWWSVERGKQR